MRSNNAVGINALYSLLRHINLISADGIKRGDNLTVDICKRNGIVIYQIQSPYARACKCLDGIAADTADAENGNSRIF